MQAMHRPVNYIFQKKFTPCHSVVLYRKFYKKVKYSVLFLNWMIIAVYIVRNVRDCLIQLKYQSTYDHYEQKLLIFTARQQNSFIFRKCSVSLLLNLDQVENGQTHCTKIVVRSNL
jgi:hypothetical protein